MTTPSPKHTPDYADNVEAVDSMDLSQEVNEITNAAQRSLFELRQQVEMRFGDRGIDEFQEMGIDEYSTMLSGLLEHNPNVNLETLSGSDKYQVTLVVQGLLEHLGYDVGEVDGLMGEKTRAAIRKMQEDAGLTPDGIAGPNTLRLLQDETQISQLKKAHEDLQSDLDKLQAINQKFEDFNSKAKPKTPDSLVTADQPIVMSQIERFKQNPGQHHEAITLTFRDEKNKRITPALDQLQGVPMSSFQAIGAEVTQQDLQKIPEGLTSLRFVNCTLPDIEASDIPFTVAQTIQTLHFSRTPGGEYLSDQNLALLQSPYLLGTFPSLKRLEFPGMVISNEIKATIKNNAKQYYGVDISIPY